MSGREYGGSRGADLRRGCVWSFVDRINDGLTNRAASKQRKYSRVSIISPKCEATSKFIKFSSLFEYIFEANRRVSHEPVQTIGPNIVHLAATGSLIQS